MQEITFKVGHTYRIAGFSVLATDERARLLAMGFTPGTYLTIQNIAPLGCPILVRLRETNIALRLNEIQLLALEPTPS